MTEGGLQSLINIIKNKPVLALPQPIHSAPPCGRKVLYSRYQLDLLESQADYVLREAQGAGHRGGHGVQDVKRFVGSFEEEVID